MSWESITTVTQALGEYLAVLAVTGTAIGVLAALALLLTRRTGPRFRYALSSIALISMVAIPSIISLRSPHALQPALLGNSQPGAEVTWMSPMQPDVARARRTSVNHWPVRSTFLTTLGGAFPIVVYMWIIGVAITGVRQLLGLLSLNDLKRSTLEVPEAVSHLVGEIKQRLGLQTPVSVRHGPDVPVPMVIGYRRPAIVVPTHHLIESKFGQLKAVLAHELAHVKRFDNPVGLLLTASMSIQFFNPIANWLWQTCALEREFACDDLALRASQISRPRYTQALAELQLATAPNGSMSMAGSRVVTRVERLLNPSNVARLRLRGFSALVWMLPLALSMTFLLSACNVAHKQGASASRSSEISSLLGEYQSVLWVTIMGNSPQTAIDQNGNLLEPTPIISIHKYTSDEGDGPVNATLDLNGLLMQAHSDQWPPEGEIEEQTRQLLMRYGIANILREALAAEPTGLHVSAYADGRQYVSVLLLPHSLSKSQVSDALDTLSRAHASRSDQAPLGNFDTNGAEPTEHHAWRLANLIMQIGAADALSPALPSQ